MRREERVTVQGPVKKQQPGGMSHRGLHAGRRMGRKPRVLVLVFSSFWGLTRSVLEN